MTTSKKQEVTPKMSSIHVMCTNSGLLVARWFGKSVSFEKKNDGERIDVDRGGRKTEETTQSQLNTFKRNHQNYQIISLKMTARRFAQNAKQCHIKLQSVQTGDEENLDNHRSGRAGKKKHKRDGNPS